jgi:hypothetical protein
LSGESSNEEARPRAALQTTTGLRKNLQNSEGEETMKRMQKVLLVLVAVAALGWVGAAHAFAQAPQAVSFQLSSNVRKVRAEGLAEAVGTLTLTASSAGSIPANATIDIDFGVEIVSDENTDGYPSPNTGAAITSSSADGDCSLDGGNDVMIDGSVMTLTFTNQCDMAANNTIVVRGIRVNANDAGDGATISASLVASVPAGTPPVTFFIVNSVPVAEVVTAFDIEIDGSTSLLTCKENPAPFDVDDVEDDNNDSDNEPFLGHEARLVIVTVKENFNQAFSDLDDEQGYADYDGNEVDMEFTVTFKDVPKDVTITIIGKDAEGPLAVVETPDILSGDEAVTSDGDEDLEFTAHIFRTASTGANEEFVLYFIATTDDVVAGAGAGFDVKVGVSFAAGDLGDGEVPAFVDNEVEGTGFTVNDCISILLFPWVANTADGAYDTGFAISNTSLDPPVIGTEPQSGKVTMYFFRNTGTNNPAPVVMSADLDGGRTTTGVLSNMVSGEFLGYAIAVCEFQYGHGFAFINNPSPGTGGAFAQGYLGLSLTNPRDAAFVANTTESSGQ